ncbi:MAG: glycosyltransferase [Muribaculaceae bacterium]|nr:glycosyltransferase [Muribaculaceae bacterium]
MIKKKILFVIESLVAAGAEKSLVTLLNELDYSKYDVDLQLFSYGGEFERYLPEQVNLLPPLPFLEFLSGHKQGTARMWISRLFYSFWIRFGKDQSIKGKARKWWICAKSNIEVFQNDYDVVIGYSQCIPTFYVVDKVRAQKKIGWVNCIYHLDGKEREWQKKYYDALDKVILVSMGALTHLKQVYPEYSDKMELMLDMISATTITRLSAEKEQPFEDSINSKLLTVARLDDRDKGYDITLEACKILRDRGLKFKWYAIGRGSYRKEMEEYIAANSLQDCFILLGTTPNPYPYIKNCDIYVQTSRHEGFGLSIAEARILNRPVVTTKFDSVYNQMVPNKNGLVVPINATAVADAIQRLLEDKSLYNSIVDFQRQEKKGNVEEIEKFYQLIEN